MGIEARSAAKEAYSSGRTEETEAKPWDAADQRSTLRGSMPQSTGCSTSWEASSPPSPLLVHTRPGSACHSSFLRNRLKYALTGREAKAILMERYVKVDGKVRTDVCYPTGFMDVISLEKSDEYFRILYGSKGRMTVHRISAEEASYKLC